VDTEPDPSSEQPPTPLTESSNALKIIRVIEAIARSDYPVGVRSLAREVGINKTSASRLLRQLLELQVLSRSEESGKYAVGPRLVAIGHAVNNRRDNLIDIGMPYLERLVQIYDETTYLAVLDGDATVYVYAIESGRPVRYVVDLYVPSPLHAGAGGRAILMGLAPERLDAYLDSQTLAPLTPVTITDPGDLRERIRQDASRGYVLSVGERVAEGAAIAAPFYLPSGSVGGAIVVAFPRQRLGEHDVDEMGAAVRRSAAELSEQLGYRTARAQPPPAS
jgi:IclR family acetate operon transcriptional repressor